MSETSFSKKGERLVTPFVGQELLYDYVRGQLDPERVEALEKLLTENRDLRSELDKIREGMQYVSELGRTGVSNVLLENIRTPSTYLHVLLTKTKFTDWPEGVKFALEGFLIALGSLALILVIPWGKVMSLREVFDRPSVVLTEITKIHNEPDGEGAAPAAAPADAQKFVFEDEGQPADKTKKDSNQKAAAAAAIKTAAAAAPAKGATAPAAPTTAADAGKAATPSAEKGITASAPDAGKKQGFLYRGTIKVTNMNDVVPKLVAFLDANGGRKAGEVELGWRKGSGAYFHFTIPEAKYQALMQEFADYGTLKIQKEPHPRVMPDGIIRLIITVDEKSEK